MAGQTLSRNAVRALERICGRLHAAKINTIIAADTGTLDFDAHKALRIGLSARPLANEFVTALNAGGGTLSQACRRAFQTASGDKLAADEIADAIDAMD